MIMMNEADTYNKRFNLQIGDIFYIAEEPTIIWTILGSCVAVVFYNKRLKISAICHAQLPGEKLQGEQCSDNCPIRCMAQLPDTNKLK